MPISLSNLIEAKAEILKPSTLVENNLEPGQIFTYTNGTQSNPLTTLCWCARVAGVALVEIWGAGGSGSLGCCCSSGIPGNPGAYARREVTFTSAGHITGCVGMSCGNADQVTFRGCSDPTAITICGGTAGTCVCMCAEGGRAGTSVCSPGDSQWNCFASMCGFCRTGSNGCGVICNFCTGMWCARAFGGTINCQGGISCTYFGHCNSCCHCCMRHIVATPAGVFARDGGVIEAPIDRNDHSSESSFGTSAYMSAISSLSKSPTVAAQYSSCWTGHRWCGCYQMTGCQPVLAMGMPGVGGWSCAGQHDYGMRGGHGVVRIRFVPS